MAEDAASSQESAVNLEERKECGLPSGCSHHSKASGKTQTLKHGLGPLGGLQCGPCGRELGQRGKALGVSAGALGLQLFPC